MDALKVQAPLEARKFLRKLLRIHILTIPSHCIHQFFSATDNPSCLIGQIPKGGALTGIRQLINLT
jgi:hypothetical protein